MKDYFGVSSDEIKTKKLWLFDMDGTIYEEETLYDGTLDLLSAIKGQGGRYVFITNNSSKSVNDYVKKVNKLGIMADADNFFTSSQAAILWLAKNKPNAKVYCQGTKSLVEELRISGVDVTENVERVDVVLVGFDMELTTAKLRNTCEILSTQEVTYIATNPDWVCPVGFGFIPDCGSICQMIKNATNKWPMFIGKPEPTMVDIVREKFGYGTDQTVVVGDRLYTDIAIGINAGATAICVLTGEATAEEIQNGNIKPSFTFNSVREICNVLKESANPEIEFKMIRSVRSKQISDDVIKCEEILESQNEQCAAVFCESLYQKYRLRMCDGTALEQLHEIYVQLMWAIRML